ncbi:hypothetical protein RJ639_043786 [Escallonia herrerae]|uniref:Protein kinase domain-containing protein n=1 Tax=Escallonia herrerae TaxID=1293975 RepID=A0AA88W9K7_9ASTE|nr:hypothetical protein RJ639_043786 [Escallonia herrerae]
MEFQITGTIGDYILGAKLGEGPLSTVWKAEHRTTAQVVALKQVHLSRLTPKLKKCLECEMTFLSSVNHPNIIRLLHFFKAEGCVFLVLEFCAGGNLASYIKHHGRVQECMARRFMSQLGAGLEVLNSHCIIHRDLKPANILLSSVESEAVLKIADFGLSRSRTSRPDGSAGMVCGSPLYMAPEILQFQQYDEKVDMWSIGTILFELLNGYPPFHGRTNVQVEPWIQANEPFMLINSRFSIPSLLISAAAEYQVMYMPSIFSVHPSSIGA